MSPTSPDFEALLRQLTTAISAVERDLATSANDRQTIRDKLAAIEGLLLGGAITETRPLKIRVEDNESTLSDLIARLRAIEAKDTTSKSGLIWQGLAIVASVIITAVVVWFLKGAGVG